MIGLFLFQNVRKFLKEDIFHQMLPHVSSDRISLDVNPASCHVTLILNLTSKSVVFPCILSSFTIKTFINVRSAQDLC